MSFFSKFRDGGVLRPFVFFTLAVFGPFSVGCSSWHIVASKHRQTTPEDFIRTVQPLELEGKVVRLYREGRVGDNVVKLRVREVELPYVRGKHTIRETPIEVDLREISMIEVREIEGWKTAIILVSVAAVVGIVILATAGDDSPSPAPPPSSTGGTGSCPIVYVRDEDGARLAGEAYAGAIFRSLQRTDLLPLPDAGQDRVSLTLANEAPETQYTDLVALVVADHGPGTRAVSTISQEIVLVGDAVAPTRATDLAGGDVTGAVAGADGDLWRSDLSLVMRDADPPRREGLVVTFPAPKDGERPVLELVYASTEWVETTVGRYLALIGDDYDRYVERRNDPRAGPLMRWWCDREGLRLEVEWKRGDEWESVGFVHPVGPVASRHVAVPLPEAAGGVDAEALVVRISGGTGFWEFDQVGLASERAGAGHTRRIAPSIARDSRNRDERETLAAADGRYQVLEDAGERLELEFDVPGAPPGRERSTFLFTSGYYNIHRPIGGANAIAHFDRIRMEPGGLARFGVELYREYHELALLASQHAAFEAE